MWFVLLRIVRTTWLLFHYSFFFAFMDTSGKNLFRKSLQACIPD